MDSSKQNNSTAVHQNGTKTDDMSGSTNQAVWTKWYNGQRPNADGDSELTETILKENGKICDKNYDISGTECELNDHLVFNDTSPRSSIPDNLRYFCTRDGVWCRNKDQVNTTCGDYAIRYRCKYSGSGSSNDSSSTMLPQFDVRIYIILAVVPILIFIARVLWTYIFRNRRQRRREERRARRRQQGRYNDDDASSTAKPPPSYHDIFGEPGHFKTSVFAISRNNLPICQTCRGLPCSVARVIDSAGSRIQKSTPSAEGTSAAPDAETAPGVDVAPNSGMNYSHQEMSLSDGVGGDRNATQSAETAAEEGSSPPQVHNPAQFTEIDLSSPSTSAEPDAWVSETATVVNEVSPQIPDASVSQTSPQRGSKQSASAVCITMSPSKLHAESSISISQPCPCACHRTIPFSHYKDLGYDNSAFTSEVGLAHPFPGMHVPPMSGLQRAWSNISVITLSELPSYEAALELMNKETKEANEVNEVKVES